MPNSFKGTVARDCQPLVFFMNRPHIFEFGLEFAEIFGFVIVSAQYDKALIQILFEDKYGF